MNRPLRHTGDDIPEMLEQAGYYTSMARQLCPVYRCRIVPTLPSVGDVSECLIPKPLDDDWSEVASILERYHFRIMESYLDLQCTFLLWAGKWTSAYDWRIESYCNL